MKVVANLYLKTCVTEDARYAIHSPDAVPHVVCGDNSLPRVSEHGTRSLKRLPFSAFDIHLQEINFRAARDIAPQIIQWLRSNGNCFSPCVGQQLSTLTPCVGNRRVAPGSATDKELQLGLMVPARSVDDDNVAQLARDPAQTYYVRRETLEHDYFPFASNQVRKLSRLEAEFSAHVQHETATHRQETTEVFKY